MSGFVVLVGGEQERSREWLEDSGYRVEGLGTWAEQTSCSEPPDAVTLDVGGLDPTDFERMVEIRTLLGLELGAYDYLSLPLDPIRLRTTLRNAIERQRLRQRVACLEEAAPTESPHGRGEEPLLPLVEIERLAIVNALRQTRGNLSAVGRQLGIGRTTLYRKLKKYDLS